MSRTKRHFTAEFKTKIILEVIEGRRTINEISSEHSIQPNLIRNWKKEFLEKAALVFDDKREDNAREKLEQERKEKEAYAKKVGQLTMQVDWLKKKSEECLGSDWEAKFTKKPYDF